MRKTLWKTGWTAAVAGLLLVSAVDAQKITFKDPVGDDNGPGNYTYPTDGVYKRGSFDLTEFSVTKKGDKVDFDVTVNSPLEDPWGMKTGFSVQMIFIFIQTDNKDLPKFTDTVPGLNVKFAEGDGWNRMVILSPQPPGRVKTEVEQKAPAAEQSAILIPNRVKGAGRTISASVDLAQLGGGDPSKWGYQVAMQSNEGFPDGKDLLTRKVNEFEGQHRFGGGTDYDCDPHVMDVLAGKGEGAPDEVQAQHDMLKYQCNPDGSTKAGAILKMVRKQ